MKSSTLFTRIDDYLYDSYGITVYAYKPWKVWTAVALIAFLGIAALTGIILWLAT